VNCRQDAQLMLSAVNLPGGIQVCQKLCVFWCFCAAALHLKSVSVILFVAMDM
jgi:hypothetical protein